MSDWLDDVSARLSPRGRYEVLRRLDGGHRNLAVLVRSEAGALFVAKTTRRSEAALAWVARLQAEAVRVGLGVPAYMVAPDGSYGAGGMTLEPYAEGRMAATADLGRIRRAMARLREATAGWPQRPGFASAAELIERAAGGDIDLTAMPPRIAAACRSAWLPLRGRRETAVHGDLNSSNLIIGNGGAILVDWDEARRDSPIFDMAPFWPRSTTVARARLAWEVAAGWQAEPAYARALATRLVDSKAAETR